MKSIYKVYSDCCAICFSFDIPIADEIHLKINTRAKRRWGLCRYISRGVYEIEISDRLLNDDVSEEATFNTMIHELIHTCPDCMNHGKEWKKWADVINRNTNYTIKRTTSCEEKGFKEVKKSYKYEVKCRDCGAKWHYNRAGNVIKNIRNCKCPYCKDFTLFVKELR